MRPAGSNRGVQGQGAGMKNVVLMGFMGTGKSSCGRTAAQQLGYRFADLDREIENKYAMTIPEIFAKYGEAYFRQREREMVRFWAAQNNVVISTGGGTVKDAENVAALKATGRLICLTADVDILLERTGRPGRRPVLDARAAELGGDRKRAIESLLAERQHIYEQADYTIDTGELSPMQVAMKITEYIRRF